MEGLRLLPTVAVPAPKKSVKTSGGSNGEMTLNLRRAVEDLRSLAGRKGALLGVIFFTTCTARGD